MPDLVGRCQSPDPPPRPSAKEAGLFGRHGWRTGGAGGGTYSLVGHASIGLRPGQNSGDTFDRATHKRIYNLMHQL